MVREMDNNVRDVLIAFVTVAGGFLTAMAVATITMRAARGLERTKWKRELYASFIHSTNEIRDAVHLIVSNTEPGLAWATHLDQGGRTLLEIKMIAPSMRKPAEAVWDAITALMSGVLKVESATVTPAGPAVPINRSRYQALDEAYRVAMLVFVDRASEELH